MSRRKVVVVGAGMGGLTAALRLARRGFKVRVLEARDGPGGLASSLDRGGLRFDAGPYVLLDRPGLEWAFEAMGTRVADHLDLRPIEDVYEVQSPGRPAVRVLASLRETASGFDRLWPGSGRRYEDFVSATWATYRRLSPLLRESRPGLGALLRTGAWPSTPFLLRSLRRVLASTDLPAPVQDALGIWTHVAGQRLDQAPSVLGFVPALIHHVGACYPRGGIGEVPRALEKMAVAAGVEIECGARVASIDSRDGRATGVVLDGGRQLEADAVVSDVGLGTYLDLGAAPAGRAARALARMPLQSPGVCAYVAARGGDAPPYLRFLLPGDGEPCRLWIRPVVVDPGVRRDGWWPARLLSPLGQEAAESWGPAGQVRHLDRVLDEPWWREGLGEWRVVERRVPSDWGRQFHLHRDSMNPVMTARLMRSGRLAHRSPWTRGLYLAGSATHPGQWVSFCAISGVLAADRVAEDLG